MMKMKIPVYYCRWIMNYLSERSQYVRLDQGVRSDCVFSNTGARFTKNLTTNRNRISYLLPLRYVYDLS